LGKNSSRNSTKKVVSSSLNWAGKEQISFTQFGKRHLDRFLIERSKTVKPTTLHHDAVATKAFFRWCVRNELIERSALADYEVHRAPASARFMPGDEDIRAVLNVLKDLMVKSSRANCLSPTVRRARTAYWI
jgi:site-specific recombinase XerD